MHNTSFNFVRNDIEHYPISPNAWALVALEAWRRGLQVTIGQDWKFILSSTDKSITFKLSRLDGTDEAKKSSQICSNKTKTKLYLDANNVPTPLGYNFKQEINLTTILQCAQKLGYPVCLKANGWSKGKGVYPFITNEDELKKNFNLLVNHLNCEDICLEKHILGDDYRVYVVGNKVVSALRRIPANILGNGKNSINELIIQKNSQRKKNPFLKNSLVNIDSEIQDKLNSSGYSLETILDNGKCFYLRNKSNASAGGDTIDVTDSISEKHKAIAIRAISSIPGLQHGGVDILTEDIKSDTSNTTVLEINLAAELGVNIYPFSGTARLIYKDIIDFYFPDTTKVETNSINNWYFNLKTPLGTLKNKIAKTIEIPPRPAPQPHTTAKS
ncbi:hypothetical protein [Endozoicomonas sp. SESOKO4]|uniref:hypothetical protein n=1 Tax=Endozoicomonas sp. SESOKO4 TaxID=2828745 RepID=UPI002148C5E0|nr:hypothetical protein [Endozoicomonas sp. SESOKO4]